MKLFGFESYADILATRTRRSAFQLKADNTQATSLAHAYKIAAANKHIGIAYHGTRDYIEKGFVSLEYVPSSDIMFGLKDVRDGGPV